ncbi:uncharacterized protein [Typha latifolia]|uniref:uncharacterized protein n=1 Tax=Typha latifolia TaxID=4733 RepID=UPI003C2DBEEB
MAAVEEFSRSVEDGLKLAKRISAGKDRSFAGTPPCPAGGMDRSSLDLLLPGAPMAYAVIGDPAIVDNPDIPSYQPHVHGRRDPPALIPLHMKEIAVEVDCLLDTAFVAVRGRWWVHCVTRSKSCDCRLVIPMGEQGSILGVEVLVGRRSFTSQTVEAGDLNLDKIAKNEGGGYLKPQFFYLTVPQVNGGTDIDLKIRWTQKLLYADGQFSINIPFRFPDYVNPLAKIFAKREKIQLNVNSGTGKEVLLQRTSHALKEKGRHGGKLSFLYEEVVENYSRKDFYFSYSVYSSDIFGSILVQSPSVNDNDQRDIFCLFLFPGNNQNRKVFRRGVVFIIDTSGSMQGKPLESVRNALSAVLLEICHEDYFNIIAFNDELRSFSSCLQPATEDMVENANNWMSTTFVAEGGTDIMHSLNEAMGLLLNNQDILPQIFLVTDGAVEDERQICSTVRTQVTSTAFIAPRISTFGIGSYCNHYFLRMLATIGRGQYGSAYDSDSIEDQMQRWFSRAWSGILANVTVDAFNHLDEFEVYPCHIPDLSVGCPLFVSGRYQGKFPDSLKVKGRLADMSDLSIDLMVQNAKDIPLEKVLAKQQIDLLTAQAWFSESKQPEEKATKLSIQSSIPSEYTCMVLLQSHSEEMDNLKQVKRYQSRKDEGLREGLLAFVRGPTVGFGNIIATVENLPAGFGEQKPTGTFNVINKAVNCCGRLADCCCCMCFIKACSKLNDQCVIAMTQFCGALSCLACSECCTELCCDGSG